MKKALFITIALFLHITVILVAQFSLLPRLKSGWQYVSDFGISLFADSATATAAKHGPSTLPGLNHGPSGAAKAAVVAGLTEERFDWLFTLPSMDRDVETIVSSVSIKNVAFAYPYPALGSKPASGMEPLPGGAAGLEGMRHSGLTGGSLADSGRNSPAMDRPSPYAPTAPRPGSGFSDSGWERIEHLPSGENWNGGQTQALTPEPGTIGLLCLGGAILRGFIRRRARALT